VGGVSGRAGAKAGGSASSLREQKRILRVSWRWKASRSSGRRRSSRGAGRKEGLDRLVVECRGSSAACERADDRGCSSDAEEGNAVSSRSPSVGTGREAREIVASATGPVLHSVRRPVHVSSLRGPHVFVGIPERIALGGIAAGQTCASGRNQHRGRRKRTSRGSPRITAPQGEGVVRQKRKVVEATVPARVERAQVWLPARR